MKLVVGLGNPGPAYDGTRHNLGNLAVRQLAREIGLPRFRSGRHGLSTQGGDATLLLPTTFMNASGLAVAAVLRGRTPDPADLVVVHDDLDLPTGRLKIRLGGSSGGHRGVASIIEETGFDGFVRVKIGIGRPPEGVDPIEYVLQRPDEAEANLLREAVSRAVEAALSILGEGVEATMNRFNRSGEADGAGEVDGAAGAHGAPGATEGAP